MASDSPAAAVCLAALLLGASSLARSQEAGHWLPDPKTVAHVDDTIRRMPGPTLQNWAATPIDTYSRYYTGVTQNGRRVIIGEFLSMDPTRSPPGIHIVSYEALPMMTGGLCSHLQMFYDVAIDRVTSLRCYGLG